MVNEDGTVAIVVNGEFYDFEALRDELIAKGHTFRSRSDSEVALHLYEEMGDAFVERLHGMFAIAVYDTRRQRLLLARDRSGKKPLYYRVTRHGVAFASEVHALVTGFPEAPPEVDLESVEEYLTLGYTCAPDTVYKGVYKLRAAHTLAIEPGRVGAAQRYWKAARHPPVRGSEADLAQELRWRLMEAVKRRMVADVPLGAFLSGGIDSSTVVAMMATLSTRPVKTFSIGFPQEAYSEVKYARMVAERYGTEHHEMTVTANMAERACTTSRGTTASPSPTRARWPPTTSPSSPASTSPSPSPATPATRTSRATSATTPPASPTPTTPSPKARSPWCARGSRPSAASSSPPSGASRRRWRRARRLGTSSSSTSSRPTGVGRSAGPALRGVAGGRALRRFTEVLEESDGRFPMARVLDLDFTTYLTDDINAKVDIASMAFALEVRCPFLDTDIVEFAARLPSHLLMRTRGKHLLRKAAEELLPWEILHRPKMGFGIPLDHWLRHDLRELLHDTLLGRAARERGVYDPGYVSRLLATLDTSAPETYAIWALFILELWFQEFIDRPTARAEVTPTLAP